MKVKVSKIDPSTGETREGNLDTSDVDVLIRTFESHRAAGPLAYRLILSRVGARVMLQGHVHGEVEGRCGRCLVPVRYDLEIESSGTFTPPPPEIREEDLELSQGDLDEDHYVDDELDLIPWVHEAVLLELNPYVLCREDCLGFCLQCGVNRNESPCDCADQVIDPRWEGLLALKRKK